MELFLIFLISFFLLYYSFNSPFLVILSWVGLYSLITILQLYGFPNSFSIGTINVGLNDIFILILEVV